MKTSVCILIFAAFISCRNPVAPHQIPEPGDTFNLGYGKQVSLANGPEITFADVSEDSRCPEDVQCVWAGNARIIIRLNTRKADLNTYLSPKQATVADYTIKLVALNPYPKAGTHFDKKDYTATLLITKK